MKAITLGAVACLFLRGQIARADFVFGEPTPIAPPVNANTTIVGASISADGLEIYYDTFEAGPEMSLKNIMVATRATTADDWSNATLVEPPVSGNSYEFNPKISADGLELYFSSGRGGGTGIYVAQRQGPKHPWESVRRLDVLNTSRINLVGSLSLDGLELYYTGQSSWEGMGTFKMARRVTKDSSWEPTAFSGPVSDGSGLAISPDGLHLVFSSESLPNGQGDSDLWMTSRRTKEADWSAPVNLGSPMNSPDSEYRPVITYDGSTILFGSGGPFTSGREGGYGLGDIWQASIRAVVDFTGDFLVDIEDLITLIEHWGQNEPLVDIGPTPFGDGVVEAADLTVLMSYWGQELYDPSLLAHWKLDETEGDVAYDSAGDHDAALLGEVLWQPEGGQTGGALQFDGAASYVSASFILDPTKQPFSVYLWIKGGQPGQTIISQRGAFGAWLLVDSAGGLATNLTFPLPAVASNVVITDDRWHRIGLVSDGAGMSLYIDDIEVIRTDTSPILPASGDLHFGAGKNLEPGAFWSGLIDVVQIYDRVVNP